MKVSGLIHRDPDNAVAKQPLALRKSDWVTLKGWFFPLIGENLERRRREQSVSAPTKLPRQTQRKLNLARVEYSPRRPVRGVRRALAEGARPATLRRWIAGQIAEIRCPVRGIEKADIQRVEHVESLGQSFKVYLLGEMESPGHAHVHTLIAVAFKGIPRFNPDAIVVAEDIAVGVKACKLGEIVR